MKTVFDPPRPEITDDMILEAAKAMVEKLGGDADAETLANAYHPGMDGFDLAKELDKSYGWDVTRAEMEMLDEMDTLVDRAHLAACRKWFEENNIQPPYPVGAHVQYRPGATGTIADTYTANGYRVGYYLIDPDERRPGGGRPLVKFEDVEPV